MRAAAIALVAIAAAVAAGCGGKGGGPSVASLNGAQTTTTGATPAAPTTGSSQSGSGFSAKLSGGIQFSRCMRTHGVPNFPDPSAGGGISITSGQGINPDSQQFQSAQRACQKYLPIGKAPSPARLAKMQETFLRFARCMRSHGVPSFPDPQISTKGGGVAVKIGGPGSGLDPSSPLFQRAQTACRQYLPGGGKAIGGPGRQVGKAVAVAP